MNLIPILVGAFGRKWRRRKNVNLALNNILPSPPLLPYGHRKRRYICAWGKEKRGGAKERKRNKIKPHVRQDREKRRTQYKDVAREGWQVESRGGGGAKSGEIMKAGAGEAERCGAA